MDQFSRMKKLIPAEDFEKLSNSHIAIFGLGGVGSYVVEALARCGVKNFTLIDNDNIELSNINRQIFATLKTVGQAKVNVAKERILSINNDTKVNTFNKFYSRENRIDISLYDYVVDAIDTVSSKLDLIEECKKLNQPIISSMGTGNKLEPTKFVVADIYETSVCPLCRIMRRELKKRDIKNLKVVYSTEVPIHLSNTDNHNESRTNQPGSIAFVPAVAGLIIASEVIKSLISK